MNPIVAADLVGFGAGDIIPVIQQFVNVKAVVLAFGVTKAFTYLVGKFMTEKMDPGKVIPRLLPVLPLILGGVFCGIFERDSHFVFEDVFRGVMSGMMAAYLYRTVKVSLFGE